jgi:hypothetical protein
MQLREPALWVKGCCPAGSEGTSDFRFVTNFNLESELDHHRASTFGSSSPCAEQHMCSIPSAEACQKFSFRAIYVYT